MNILLVLAVIFCLVALLCTIKIIKISDLQPKIIDFIVYAETLYNKGENNKKFNYVFERLYDILPAPFKLMFSEKQLKQLIQEVFNITKIALDYGVKK